MEEIIDRSGNLSIFTKKFIVDFELPKWKSLNLQSKLFDPYLSDSEEKVIELGTLGKIIESYKDSEDPELRDINIQDLKEIDYELFQSLSTKKLNILVSIEKYKNKREFLSIVYDEVSTPNHLNQDIRLDSTAPINHITPKKKRGFFSRLFKRDDHDLREHTKKIEEEIKTQQEEAKLDVFKFFSLVKLEAKKEIPIYLERIAGYIKAIKNAQDIEQTALIDKLIGQIFLNKYESILRSIGLGTRISESTLVDFINKTEKGINLCYIKNFTRPIPDEVRKLKQKADSAEVFDNYAILFYDPNGKIYSKTKEEKEKERQKKADPILFGMIEGSRNLYYITDWIDEYCDLTLDKFIETLGIKKEDLTIEDKIIL